MIIMERSDDETSRWLPVEHHQDSQGFEGFNLFWLFQIY